MLTRHRRRGGRDARRIAQSSAGGRRQRARRARPSTCARASPIRKPRALSGGNLQKFVVGRELDRQPRVLVVNQPTWGVDAGAAATIRQALIDLARAGSAVLVISQDLDEIFEIADRIAVISRGELSEAYPAAEMTCEKIGLLMAGAHEKVGARRKGEAPCGSCLKAPAGSARARWRCCRRVIAIAAHAHRRRHHLRLARARSAARPLCLFRRAADRDLVARAAAREGGAPGADRRAALPSATSPMSGTSAPRASSPSAPSWAASIPVLFPDWQSPLGLLAMLVLGIVGGMVYGAIPGAL